MKKIEKRYQVIFASLQQSKNIYIKGEKISSLKLIQGSCADQNVDAVVNAATRNLSAGGGICGVIFKKAGSPLFMTNANKSEEPECTNLDDIERWNARWRHSFWRSKYNSRLQFRRIKNFKDRSNFKRTNNKSNKYEVKINI